MKYPEDFINKIICGDCIEVMKEMPKESIDMVITSPPYWGLRDYGTGPDQLGLEATPELYIKHLTEIFNEVKRVLKKEGTFWLVVGDTYWGGKGKSGYPLPHEEDERYRQGKTLQHGYQVPGYMEMRPADGKHDFIQPKCLCMIPERLAWSLIQNGWILRNKNIWYKKNAMPASVTDRFNNTYEFVYMFSKSQRYYFDLDAVREPHSRDWSKENWAREYCKDGKKEVHLKKTNIWALHGGKKSVAECFNPLGKNPGDVFEIATQPFPEAHFAVFPEKLCEKPIKAGCSEGGIVLDPFCGAGTALYVAKEMNRQYVGIDIKQDYCKIAEGRLAQGVL